MNYFERWWTDYSNRITTAGDLEKAAAKAAYFEAMKLAYTVARGTEKLKESGNRQLYWKGRADAASDIRALAQ